MPLARLHDDLQRLVLLECDFDTLCTLLACCAAIGRCATATLRSQGWRAQLQNERALRLAAWSSDSIFEAVVGAFEHEVSGIDMHDRKVAAYNRKDSAVKAWDVATAALTLNLGFDSNVRMATTRNGLLAILGDRPTGAQAHIYDLASQGLVCSLGNDVESIAWAGCERASGASGGCGGEAASHHTQELIVLSSVSSALAGTAVPAAARSHVQLWRVPHAGAAGRCAEASCEGSVEEESEGLRKNQKDSHAEASCEGSVEVGESWRSCLALHVDGSTAAVLHTTACDPVHRRPPTLSIEVLLVPSLARLHTIHTSIAFFGPRCPPMAAHGGSIALAGAGAAVSVWALGAAAAGRGGAGATSSAVHAAAAPPEPTTLCVVPEHIRQNDQSVVAALAMHDGLLATTVVMPRGRWRGVHVWDVSTRTLLREVALPERRHAHFHRNVCAF